MQTDKLLSLTIHTPTELFYQDKIQKITIPGTKSPFQVLYNHAAIISTIDKGKIKFVDAQDKEFIFTISSGVVEVLNNEITILGENIEKIQ
ncbi:MAG: F0F1 ATP synthase subunit epsilon [Bacteroidetes bacterium]|nr:F0F1 ATP synthase subunit epsilon [Bacteroidota bacterium]